MQGKIASKSFLSPLGVRKYGSETVTLEKLGASQNRYNGSQGEASMVRYVSSEAKFDTPETAISMEQK